jgi:AraC family transcriptional regulator
MAAVIPAAEASEWLAEGSHETVEFYLSAGLLQQVASEIHGPAAGAVQVRDGAFHFDDGLARYAMAARERLRDPEAVTGVELEAVANLLAAHLLRRYSSLSCRAAARADGRLSPDGLRTVTEYILAHLDSALTLRELATVVGMNQYRFARAFQVATGESPHKYIIRRRIGNAQALLAASDMPLSRIAAAVGFSSQSHMTLAFQRTLAITPGRYRHETGRPIAR